MSSKVVQYFEKAYQEILRLESFDQAKADRLKAELMNELDSVIGIIVDDSEKTIVIESELNNEIKLNLN